MRTESAETGPGRVLVVDDDRAYGELVLAQLATLGHQAVWVASGREGLERIRQEGFDLVLLDLLMPAMDGYEVLAELKADARFQHLPVVVLTAMENLESTVKCIELGAEDYLLKTSSLVLLEARVKACLEKKRLRDTERRYLAGLEREMQTGRRIQRNFLPDRLPDVLGWEIAARFRGAREVSGDFYDAFVLTAEGHVAFVIGDVCGKGVGAALFMALLRSLLRASAMHDFLMMWSDLPRGVAEVDAQARIKDAVEFTNEYIARTHGRANTFASLFMGAFNRETGLLHYINAGHPSAILIEPDGRQQHLERSGPAVGVIPETTYVVHRRQVEPGQTLFLFTDGLLDACNTQGEAFGEERLTALLRKAGPAEELLDRLTAALERYMGDVSPFDDVTMMAVSRREAREQAA